MSRPRTAVHAIEWANTSPSRAHWYSSSCGRIELALTLEDAQSGCHSGACDADIAVLICVPYLAEQLAKVDADVARQVAAESGRNDYVEDMSDHDANIRYVLWMACGDIIDAAEQS